MIIAKLALPLQLVWHGAAETSDNYPLKRVQTPGIDYAYCVCTLYNQPGQVKHLCPN